MNAQTTTSQPIPEFVAGPGAQGFEETATAASPAPAKAPLSPSTVKSFSIASFVLGIASIVSGWTLVAPIIGLVLGLKALSNNTPDRTMTLWGVWLNGIMLALTAIALVVMLVLLVVLGFSVGFAA